MDEQRTGGCLCGGVRYAVAGPMRDVFECHCERCRRTTGHVMAATAASAEAVTFTADATLRWFHPADDPNVRYGFCSVCGSTLFWGLLDRPDHLSITAGTLDQPTGLRTTQAWFADHVADYHRLDPALTAIPGDGRT